MNMTTVNTIYARIAILLLAANCALTGYAVYTMSKIQTDALSINSDTGVAKTTVAKRR